jgi:multiple sugar transport system substrate-binding protein
MGNRELRIWNWVWRTGGSPFASLLLLCILAMGFIPGCRQSRDSSTVIHFWALGAEGENVQQLIPEFERRNPGIKVRLHAIPWTAAHEKLLTAYAGNSMPDVFQLGNTWIPEFLILRAIEPLDSLAAHSRVISKSAYFSGIWDTNVSDGHIVGVPWYVDTRVLFYRTDIMARAGFDEPPRTWDEWDRLCRRIVETGGPEEHFAILLPTNEWAPAVILGMQTGSALLKDQDCYGNFSGPEFQKAFEFYTDFFRKKYAPVGLTKVINYYQSFAEGYFALYITGPWNIGEFQRRMPPELQDKWMTAPLPGPVPGKPGVSLAGGSSLAIASSSQVKEAAWKLVEFLSEPPQQLAFYRLTGDLPARIEAWQDTTFTRNRYARAFYEQLKAVMAPPKVPQWEQIAMKVQDYADITSRETMSPAEALKQLDHDVNVILEKRRWMVHGK